MKIKFRILFFISLNFLSQNGAAQLIDSNSDFEGYVSATVLNVRSSPNKNSQVITQLKQGDLVKIYGDEYNYWYKIEVDGYVGFVSKKYVKVEKTFFENLSFSKTQWVFIIVGVFLFLLIFLLYGSALRSYGSTIILLSTFFYYVFGLLFNVLTLGVVMSSSLQTSNYSFFYIIISYCLAIVVGILSIISYFKNVSTPIIIVAIIMLVLDSLSFAIYGIILDVSIILGGIIVLVGYRQIGLKNS